MAQGPLAGLKLIEMAGIGPAPLAAMMLADLGAEVLRIDRLTPSDLGIARPVAFDYALRGRPSLALDLKTPQAVALLLDLISEADGLIEGFRPGVMERLGLGPEACLARNPRLAYGRLTGWGQQGPLAQTAGHDLTYLAQSGVLDLLGRADGPPTPPANLLGDYGGGSFLMVAGLLAAIWQAGRSGQGQVVDAAIVDGVSLMALPMAGLIAAGLHGGGRGRNLLDGGAPFYDSYLCACGGYLAVAPIEGKFRAVFLAGLGLSPDDLPDMSAPANWPRARAVLARRILAQSRDHWAEVFSGSDACATPVLSLSEARAHPASVARGSWIEIAGQPQPAPGPRFSATPPAEPSPPAARGEGGADALARWGIAPHRISAARAAGYML